jgi:hypothetical protein
MPQRLCRPHRLAACALALSAATGAAFAEEAGASGSLTLPAPEAGHLVVARARLVPAGPGARPPLPRVAALRRGALGRGTVVVAGVSRDARVARRAYASIVVARTAGAVPGAPAVALRVAGAWTVAEVRQVGVDPAGLARGEVAAGPRLGRLARSTPIRPLAGQRLPGLGPQQLARSAFALAFAPGSPSSTRVAARVGRALGLALPSPSRRGFPLQPPVTAAAVAPGSCPARPGFVALQSPAAAERVMSSGTQALRGLADLGVPHSMLSGIDGRRQAAIVWGYDIVGLGGAEMARRLRAAIDSVPSHLVILDRVEGAAWSDGAPAEPPVVDPGSAGVALRDAMGRLSVATPWGGTYADRVHFWIGPGLHSAIGAGLGPNHNLGRDGKPHRRTYHEALRAMAQGAGVWNQMFHGPWPGRPPQHLTVGEWVRWPGGFADLWTRLGGRLDRVHFLLAQSPSPPAGDLPPGAGGSPMSAAFALARQPGTNLAILCNGPGALNVESQADAWLRALHAAFPAV